MYFLTALVLSVSAQQVDAAQFTRLIAAAMADIRDAAFVFEGESKFVGPREAVKGDIAELTTTYQGSFAARSDGSVFVDSYRRRTIKGVPLLTRDTGSVFQDRTERLIRDPDQKSAQPQKHSRAAPRSLIAPGSPLRMVYSWQFRNADPSEFPDFEALGTEAIEGRRCLHVAFNTYASAKTLPIPRSHYWFDLDRNGHPIKVEYREGDRLVSRATIKLSQVDAEDGSRPWYPVRGLFESFKMTSRGAEGPVTREADQPFTREIVDVVTSSLRLNAGLPDEVFSIASNGGATDTSGLKALRSEFLNPVPRPKERTDFKSVQERLDRDLEQAEGQAKRLDASRMDEGLPWGQWSLFLMVGSGLLITTLAGFLMWRRR